MSPVLKAGLWRINITPPINIPLAGSWYDRPIKEYKTDLFANALVLEDADKEIAIVSADVCFIPGKLALDIIAAIEKECNIDAKNIIIAATHTHSGPRLLKENYDSYTENFKMLVVSSVFMAQKRKEAIKIGVGSKGNHDFIHNRRLRKPDGSIVVNFASYDFIKDCTEEGAIDPEVLVLKIDNEKGKPIGFIINYANHNNAASGSYINSDISGYIAKLIRKIYGDDVVTVFLLGACGDVNWLNFKDTTRKDDPKNYYKKIATSLMGTMMEIIAKMKYPEINEIGLLHKRLNITERDFNEYDTKIDNTFGKGGFYDVFISAKKESEGKKLPEHIVDIHTISMGNDIVIATSPFEMFAEYGLLIKSKSPYKYTFVSTLTNGCMNYLPTPKDFKQGGYEVRKPANIVDEKTGGEIVDTTLELLNKLKEYC